MTRAQHPRQGQGRPRTGAKGDDHLSALGRLVEGAFPDPTQFFDHGLALLVQQLGVDQAVISRITDLGWEAFWWATAEGVTADASVHQPVQSFCPVVLEHPTRPLVIRDAAADEARASHEAHQKLGTRAFLGVPLRTSGKFLGVLSASSRRAKSWTRAEIAMVSALANLFSKTLEVEQLKHELYLTRDALDLTTAVVEDSALESPASHLPNRHYLEIWLRANLYLARRRNECMGVIKWSAPVSHEERRVLQQVAQALRGEDLLVDLGGELLLLLPRTEQDGACVLLDRIRARIGPVPMGATIWVPLHRADREDLPLTHACHRASLALDHSRELARGGAGEVIWDLLIANPEDFADVTHPW